MANVLASSSTFEYNSPLRVAEVRCNLLKADIRVKPVKLADPKKTRILKLGRRTRFCIVKRKSDKLMALYITLKKRIGIKEPLL